MAEVAHITIPDDTVGQTLRSVSALVFHVPNEGGPSCHEAICLHLDSRSITIRALTDTSELLVETSNLEIPDDQEFAGCYEIADISHHQSFRPFIGKRIRKWWSLTNDMEYSDGFMIALSHHDLVCFIAMNNKVSTLHLSGEQCS